MDYTRPGIVQYFAGKNVFITGGSGFIGKVLIEKLLRDCPDIGKIYVLLREKKGDCVEKRLEKILENKLFDTLRSQNIKALDKIVPLKGDAGQLKLGLSEQDLSTIKETVNVIYNSTASIRFDDFLKDSIMLNTRSTREIVLIAKETKHLDVLMHVSTTYCNSDRQTVEEKLYPPHGDWRESIELAEQYDSHILDVLTEKFTGKLPNTYTFTKSLAEHVVNDLCNKQLPAIIFRPSIVVATLKDPVVGWLDNFNGPVGMCIATGKGILRSVYTPPTTLTEYIPVDLVIRSMIIATWHKATCRYRDLEEKFETAVYNSSNNSFQPINYKQLMQIGSEMYKELPLNNVVWYPHNEPTGCWYNHFYKLLFYQLIPALMIDGMLRLIGKKPMLFKLHRRIYIANMALQFFLLRNWKFPNDKCVELDKYLHEDEKETFVAYCDFQDLNLFDYFWKVKLGARKYLLNESEESLETAKKHTMRMWYLYIIWNILWYTGLFWLIFFKFNIISVITNKLYSLCL